jgi:hypothetical protein
MKSADIWVKMWLYMRRVNVQDYLWTLHVSGVVKIFSLECMQ